MQRTVSAPPASVNTPALYRINWRGLRMHVRAHHGQMLSLLRLLRADGQDVAIC